MTKEQINENKQRFIDLCRQHIQREGIEQVLEYLMEKTDFFEAPSSSMFHLNEDGGLCQHSLNVFDTACKVYESVAKPAIESGNSPFVKEVSLESIAIATLFHDICKVKFYYKKEKWKKDNVGKWHSFMGYEVKDDFPYGHGEKSCLMLNWYMRLTMDEMLAIRWHMGMFDVAESGSSQRMAFYNATDKSPLVSIVHAADFLSSKLLEKTTTFEP